MNEEQKVLVVGAGLAGSEVAHFLASRGIKVILVECKTKQLNPAQKLPLFAELVCTNSLKSKDPHSAHGLLKTEMKAMGSLILEAALHSQVPAGDALAVDRELFSGFITNRLKNHPLIQVIEEEVENPLEFSKKYQANYTVIATGPLTTSPLEKWLQSNLSQEDFYFYDAIAPVVDADSLDYSKLYFKDRHKVPDESADYLNAPFNKEQYLHFIDELTKAQKVPPKNFEEAKFFESCLPVDLMAERGVDTARFSCMKPIGLELPDGGRPYAVVQLRKENLLGSAFNLVGFQTRLTYPEQKRVFQLIPGLEQASFIHLGSVHRNTYLNAKKLLNIDMSSKQYPELYFAGQITGVEGYTESSAMGLYVAHQIFRRIKGEAPIKWPVETCLGAMTHYLMSSDKPVPSNINFGLLPSVELSREDRKAKDKKKRRKELVALQAIEIFQSFQNQLQS